MDFDCYLTIDQQEYQDIKDYLEDFGNPGKVVTVVNIFDCQQTTNYDFHALKDVLEIVNRWDF